MTGLADNTSDDPDGSMSEKNAQFTASEELQLVVRVKGDFGFVFYYPIPQDFDTSTRWTYNTLLRADIIAIRIYSNEGRLLLRQLLALYRVVSLTVTPEEIAVTFSIDEEKTNRAGIRGDVLANIKYFAAQHMVATR